MSDPVFDVIVLGLGGMGTAAAYELARRGRRVLGLEQFALGHDQGSSHGQTRIIRQAYYEHPAYVPLVQRAFERWRDLETRLGRRLLTPCPCLSLGAPDSELLAGVRRAADEHQLPIEALDVAELRRRYPQFRFDDRVVGLVEESAGFLYVDDCVRAQADAARDLGAILHDQEPALGWQADPGGVAVETPKGRYRGARLVLTAGPWAGRLLGAVGGCLSVMRQVALWWGPRDEARFRPDVFPVFIADLPSGAFYGVPAVDEFGIKVARHYGAPELREPSAVGRAVTAADEEPVRAFVRDHLPDANGPVRRASVCMYTLTPDRHFILDVHPDHPQVAVAAGFSGHGFKFAPVVGEILADLADTGRTEHRIELFRLARFGGQAVRPW
jgi:sarcosine oxidase